MTGSGSTADIALAERRTAVDRGSHVQANRRRATRCRRPPPRWWPTAAIANISNIGHGDAHAKGDTDITSPANPLPFSIRFPSADDRRTANQLAHLLAVQRAGEAVLQTTDSETKVVVEITITRAISDLFRKVLHEIGSGNAVSIVPIQRDLTTQQAADLLNVSRPYLIKLLEAGDIAFNTVGRHRRIKAEDLFAYKATRDQARSSVMDELVGNDADLY